MKTKTCTRCKGTGFRNTPVAHMGVPGLCYGCDGKGTQKWVTKEEINEARDRRWAAHFDSIAADGKQAAELTEFYSLFQSWADEAPATPGAKRYASRLRRRLRDARKLVDHLRSRWAGGKECQRAEKKAKRGEWVSLSHKP